MPTRKQRRRAAKEKRHEYEYVYVDAEGNELEAPEEELEPGKREREQRRNGAKSTAAKQPQQRGRRGRRVPQPPSWERAAKRALLLGGVVFVLFSFSTRSGSNRYLAALVPAVIYTALFIPFTYMIDRFAYRRWQARQQAGPPAKKR
jgi:hypothetical protein